MSEIALKEMSDLFSLLPVLGGQRGLVVFWWAVVGGAPLVGQLDFLASDASCSIHDLRWNALRDCHSLYVRI